MIPLNTTWDTVLMLLIAAGVGLIGGVGAALLEMRRDPKKLKDLKGLVFSSVVLGGIAAVAILYFFSPEETHVVVVKGTSEIVTGYSLTKLVALALIVGSAGAGFLLILQKKTLDLAVAKEETAEKSEEAVKKAGDAQAIQAKATELMRGVGNEAKSLAKAGVTESVEPMIRKALEDVSPQQVSEETVATVAKEIGDQAGAALDDSIDPVVEGAQKRILATSVAPEPVESATGQEPEQPNAPS
jgi:hypothetical protein